MLLLLPRNFLKKVLYFAMWFCTYKGLQSSYKGCKGVKIVMHKFPKNVPRKVMGATITFLGVQTTFFKNDERWSPSVISRA